MLGTRISVQEYPAAFAEAIVNMRLNVLVTLTRRINDAFMAFPLLVPGPFGEARSVFV
jgi:hypothetical protein